MIFLTVWTKIAYYKQLWLFWKTHILCHHAYHGIHFESSQLIIVTHYFLCKLGRRSGRPVQNRVHIVFMFFLFFFSWNISRLLAVLFLKKKFNILLGSGLSLFSVNTFFLQTMSTLIFGYHIRVVYRGTDTLNLT